MRADRTLLVLALATNGLITGATLDQAIKQLPARKEIGVEAYSAYSQAGDLGNGVAWYAVLGVGTALLTLVAVVVTLRTNRVGKAKAALWIAAAGTVGHLGVTAFAAPLNFSQKDAAGLDELTDTFNSFERLNALRAALMVLTLLAMIAAVQRSGGAQPAGRAS